uniref:Biotin carboxyl carrier protein of acetyl-CoA carboxylase n=1 Tax=Titanophycus setchellii TaxID=940129 RepID=A0A1G4NYA8_9FLOR|nr:Acetyl-CoA carboxylase, biotin carboxyl carrier protein [Titanophycus setchellii]SCW23625.1 Acetyl-CoA carboxylase, biotin carboxyl carrier protein [Titanophycus setchellii]
MQFNLLDLKELLSCLKQNNVKCLNIVEREFELTINKEIIEKYKTSLIGHRNSKVASKPVANNITAEKNNETEQIAVLERSKQEASMYFTIVSPMVGTFYRSPGPNEPFFIELHDTVKLNQTVCIVEAMKLMNEIESEINGTVTEILVEDGDIVDCGQPLMKIKPN